MARNGRARARIRPGKTQIEHPALMVIVNQANVWAGWQFDDHRAVFHIDNSRSIGRVGIEGESNLTRSGGSDADPFIVVDPDRAVPVSKPWVFRI
jgi:hypothetical protein